VWTGQSSGLSAPSGLAALPPLTVSPAIGETEERLEGKHVVIISKQLEIVKNPEAWISKLDLAYEAMTEMTAGEAESVRTPDGRITIIEDPSVEGAAYAGNPIRIAPELLRVLIENAWNAKGDPGFGLIHELGHDFQFDFPGFMLTEGESRVPEAFANLLLCYAYEKMQPPFILIDRGFNGFVDLENNFYIQRATNYLSGRRSFEEIKRNDDAFVGLLLLLRDEYGWKLYRDTFAAHRSLSREQIPTSEMEKLRLFVSFLSNAAGEDLRKRFSEWGFPVSSKSGYSVRTDKQDYRIGETVTTFVEIPAVYCLCKYRLIVYTPDGSQTTLDLGQLLPANTYTFTSTADSPAGERRVELWNEVELLAQASFNVVKDGGEWRLWTDKSQYYIHKDSVKIYVAPEIALGVCLWLVINQPDGSKERYPEASEGCLRPGEQSVTLAARDQLGHFIVELWLRVVAPDAPSKVAATCHFEVIKEGGFFVHLFSATTDGKYENVGKIYFAGWEYTPHAQVYVPSVGEYGVEASAPTDYQFSHWEVSGGVRVEKEYSSSTNAHVDAEGYLKAWFKLGDEPPNTKFRASVERGELSSHVSAGFINVAVFQILDGLDAGGGIKVGAKVTVTDVRTNGRCSKPNRASIDDVVYQLPFPPAVEVYGSGDTEQVLVDCAPEYVRNLSAQDVAFNGMVVQATDWDIVVRIADTELNPYGVLPSRALVFVDASPCYEHHTCPVELPFKALDQISVRGKFYGLQAGYGDIREKMPYIFVHEPQHYATPKKYTITVNTSPPGLDDPQGGGRYAPNTQVTISVTDVDGYGFQKWQRDGVDYSTETSFQYTVDASRTFTAIYQPGQPSRCVYSADDPSKFTCVSYLLERVNANPDHPDIEGKTVKVHVLVHNKLDISETGLDPGTRLFLLILGLNRITGGDLLSDAIKYFRNVVRFYVIVGDLTGETANSFAPVFIVAGLEKPPPDVKEGSIIVITGKIKHTEGTLANYLEVSDHQEAKPAEDFLSLADLVDSCRKVQDWPPLLDCSQPIASRIGQSVTVVGQVKDRDSVEGRSRVLIGHANTFLVTRSAWIQVPSALVPPDKGAIITVHGRVTSDFIDAESIVINSGTQSPISGPEYESTLTAVAHSPIALSLYDSQGRHTGPVIDAQGNLIKVDREIPRSYYDGFGSEMQYVVVADAIDTYEIRVVGTSDGTFSLTATKTTGTQVQYLANVSDQRISKGQEISFGGAQQRTVTFYADPASGTISADGTLLSNGSTATYATGTRVRITANAPSGYAFSSWSASGVNVDNTVALETYMTVSGNGWVRAVFSQTPPPQRCTVTFYADPPSGSISADGTPMPGGSAATYATDARIHITATPPSGYMFSNWAATGVRVDNTIVPDTYMTVSSSGQLRAVFTQIPPEPQPQPNYVMASAITLIAVAAVTAVAIGYRHRGPKTGQTPR